MTKRLLVLLLALVFLPALAGDKPDGAKKTVRLLTIGNSFSANATRNLSNIVAASGNTLIHRPIVVGGASMELHAGKMKSFETDPKLTNGYYSSKKSLKQELLSDKWDFVTIQQASIKSHDLSTYQPFANQLRDYVKQHAPQAELLIHQTWEYRVDDPRFSVKNPKEGEPKSQDEMYQMLTAAYKAIAKELGIRRIPVGDAFHLANNDPKWAFKPDATFNPKTAAEPSLPDQTHSLNVGWQWKKGKDGKVTLNMDGHHANIAGEYLGACVFFEVLYGESAVGNSFVPKGLSSEDAKYLQETAHKAVLGAEPENSKVACAAPGRSGALLNLKKP